MQVLHATPFLPSISLGETRGSALTYTPSFVDVGKVRLRMEALAFRWEALHGRETFFPTEFMEKAVQEAKSMIRGQVRVEGWQDGRVRIRATDNWATYIYEFTLQKR